MKKMIASIMLVMFVICGSSCFVFGAETPKEFAVTTPGEWLPAGDVGFYTNPKDDSNTISIELNEALTDFGQVVKPDNFKGMRDKISPKGAELLDRLIATNNYRGYILSHRALVLIKYRSESWPELIKEFVDIYSKLK